MDGNRIAEFLKQLHKTRRRLKTEEMEVLYGLAKHSSAAIRSEVASLLVDHYEEESERVLLQLSYDREHTVRIGAVDSLCIARKESALQRLLELVEHDDSYMVRGYAVHSFYDVFINITGDSTKACHTISKTLRPLLEREENTWVKTCYYCVLYLCGDKEYLPAILECLESDDYYVRNSVLTTFEDILDDDNKVEIWEAIQDALPYEDNESLSLKMEELLAAIEDFDGDPL